MNSSDVSLWPYMLLTAFWAVVCGLFLYRWWRFKERLQRMMDGLEPLPPSRMPNRFDSSQAGRI